MRYNIAKTITILVGIMIFLLVIYNEKTTEPIRDPAWDKIELNDDGSIRHCPCPSPEPGPTPTMGNI